ncbi:hypothetical protein D9M72_203880 [compost metagenome]
MGEVADQAEAATEVLQADAIAGFTDRLAKRPEFAGRRQVAFVQFQGEQLRLLGMGLEQGEQALALFARAQAGGGQAEGDGRWRLLQVCQAVLEHRQVEACGPAQAIDPGQESPGGDRFTLGIEQARQYLVVQGFGGVGAQAHRLEEQAQLALVQRIVDPGAPVVQALARRGVEVVQAYPGAVAALRRLGQGLVGAAHDPVDVFARPVGGDAEQGDRAAVTGAGGMQVFQLTGKVGSQLFGIFPGDTGAEQGELAAAAARCQPVGIAPFLHQVAEDFSDFADQRVGALAAEALVESAEVVDPQQQEVAGGVLVVGHQLVGQADIELAPVGKAGEAVLVGLFAQAFAARGFFREEVAQLVHHLVHGQHHAAQFRGTRNLGQGEEFAAADGFGLLHHVVQGAQLRAQQPGADQGADHAAEQQPGEAADGTVPELGQGELRMAEHLHARGLLPAAHDQRVAALGLQVDQAGEPARHLFTAGGGAAFGDHAAIGDAHHADAGEVAAVEDGADHQLDHRRVVHVGRHGQTEGGGGVLGVGAQLAEQLLAGTFHARDEAAGEGQREQQADGQEQLLE